MQFFIPFDVWILGKFNYRQTGYLVNYPSGKTKFLQHNFVINYTKQFVIENA